MAKKNRIYYLLNWSNGGARNLVNFYFESNKESNGENLESKLEWKVLAPFFDSNLVKSAVKNLPENGQDWIDKLSHSELREALIDIIKTSVICYKNRLDLDFTLVKRQIIFTRNYSSYRVEGIRNIVNYLLKSGPPIFDVIIRVMTDPIVYGMEEQLPHENFGYLYNDLWETLENEGMIPPLVFGRT